MAKMILAAGKGVLVFLQSLFSGMFTPAKKKRKANHLFNRKKQEAKSMYRHSIFGAAALLVAGVAALVGTYLFLKAKEEELAEYEDILFEEFEDAPEDFYEGSFDETPKAGEYEAPLDFNQ